VNYFSPLSLLVKFILLARANLTALSNISLCRDSFNLQVCGVETLSIVSSGNVSKTIGSGFLRYLIM